MEIPLNARRAVFILGFAGRRANRGKNMHNRIGLQLLTRYRWQSAYIRRTG
jgi:hypothetical protein